MILEESENLKLERIATVRTKRGEEFLVNLDRAAIALAELFSDHDNEKRGGWSLGTPWYADELSKLRAASLDRVSQ
jgi:hypothetical protein